MEENIIITHEIIKGLESGKLVLHTNEEWIWFEDDKGNKVMNLGKFIRGLGKEVDDYNKGGGEDWNKEFKK